MKSFNILSFIAISLILAGCSLKKKPSSSYTDYDRGIYFYSLGKSDSAFLMFTRYVNYPYDSLKKGTAYRYMGDILWEAGDLHGAEESATGAIRTLDTLNTNHRIELGYAYHLLANVYLDLQQYDEAINMYNKAKRFSNEPDFVIELMNGKAVALQKKREYNDAVTVYDSMLLLKPADQSLVARILDNRTKTKWLQNPAYPALPEFWHALKIRIDSQFNRGLNASYAHLADYYVNVNPDSALWYADKMFQQAQLIQSPEDKLEAIDKLIRLNNPSTLRHWYSEFKRLSDSLQFSRDTTRNRYALMRYDSQKSKADNLELKEHVTRQRLWMYGLGVLAIIIITWLGRWNNKRRKRIRQEAENLIQDSKLKTSQKVHDVVANGLYRIMNELEHGKTIEKEPLINKIEGLYERSRNISYEDNPSNNSKDYEKQIPQLLSSFANEQTNVIIVGDQQTFWSKITEAQKHELYLVLNEIMINMQKHSRAKNVVIDFMEEYNKGVINYKDDGTGFPPGLKFGNGLRNTVSRIKSLNGAINFGKSGKEGASIAISFPIQSNKV